MKINKSASAKWSGNLKEGKGHISVESGAFTDQPYGFNTRFEDKKGTNPEELIGAAHASCFTMALSKILGEVGHTADKMETKARITLEKIEGDFAITASHLFLEAKVPGISEEAFKECAEKAKANCPVSKLFRADIGLDAKLLN